MRTKKDNDRTITQDMIHSAPYVWVGSEPYDRSEIHEAADFLVVHQHMHYKSIKKKN